MSASDSAKDVPCPHGWVWGAVAPQTTPCPYCVCAALRQRAAALEAKLAKAVEASYGAGCGCTAAKQYLCWGCVKRLWAVLEDADGHS